MLLVAGRVRDLAETQHNPARFLLQSVPSRAQQFSTGNLCPSNIMLRGNVELQRLLQSPFAPSKTGEHLKLRRGPAQLTASFPNN